MSKRQQKQRKISSSPFLICAAPIFVNLDDKERVEQAAMAFNDDLVSAEVADDTFWKPFLAARNSFDKMATAIAEEHGWGLSDARRMLAVAMGVYMDRWAPELTANLIQSTEDDRLLQWCVSQLARFATWKDGPYEIGALKLIESAESYVRSYRYGKEEGNRSLLYSEDWPTNVQLFLDEMNTDRQNIALEGGVLDDFTQYAIEAYGRPTLREVRTGIYMVDPEASSFMMIGSAGPELTYLAWSGPLIGQDEESPDPMQYVTMPYLAWATRIFAYGYVMDKLIKYAGASGGQYVTEKGLKAVLRKGYIRAREVLKEALITYPPPILSIR